MAPTSVHCTRADGLNRQLRPTSTALSCSGSSESLILGLDGCRVSKEQPLRHVVQRARTGLPALEPALRASTATDRQHAAGRARVIAAADALVEAAERHPLAHILARCNVSDTELVVRVGRDVRGLCAVEQLPGGID